MEKKNQNETEILKSKITELNKKIEQKNNLIESKNKEMLDLKKEFSDKFAEKEEIITQLKKKMNNMSNNFAEMLKVICIIVLRTHWKKCRRELKCLNGIHN
jgi:predicted  nucleic acid-binding Zn-ribbon protein